MREQYHNALNGSALGLRRFSNNLSRYHIHESSSNKYGVLPVASCLKFQKFACLPVGSQSNCIFKGY